MSARIACNVLLVFGLLGMGVAQDAVAPQPAASLSSPALTTLPIGIGDMLDVNVFDTPELSGRLRVNEHGEVALPVGRPVMVSDLTAEQAARSLEKELTASDMMLHPSVSVTIVEFANQGVTVMGEIRNPGVYPYLGSKSLFDFITAAGGLAPTASKTVGIIHRRTPDVTQTVDMSDPNGHFGLTNISIWPGDTIIVKKAGIFYILGAVGKPGAYLVDNNHRVSVLEALALASGTGPTAKLSKTRLFRKTETGKEDLPLPLNQIIANKIPDSPLQDGDIIFVPASGLKQTAIGVLPGMASAAVYHVP